MLLVTPMASAKSCTINPRSLRHADNERLVGTFAIYSLLLTLFSLVQGQPPVHRGRGLSFHLYAFRRVMSRRHEQGHLQHSP